MKRIIALDPGGTTGWATWDDRPFERMPDAIRNDHFEWGQLGPHEHHDALWTLLTDRLEGDLTVVCESFEFRQNKQRDNINLMSREYIGVTKLFGQRYNIPVVFQTAATGKGFVSDEKLKVMDMWVAGQQHARDAKRHLITYMVNKEHRHDLIESWRNLA